MNDQSSCIVIFLYKINIAPWLMRTASTMLAPWHCHLPRFVYDAYELYENNMAQSIKLMHEKRAFTSIKKAFAVCLSDSALSIFETQGLVAAVLKKRSLMHKILLFHLLSHTALSAKTRHRERSEILWKKCSIALW